LQGLKKTIVVVTGHRSGIGQAISQCFTDLGATVYGLSEPEHDLRRLDQIPVWLREIYEKTGRVDVLVNNAGVNHIGNIEQTTLDQLDELMTINVKAAFLTMQSILPWMRAAGFGRVINIASDQAVAAKRYGAAYASSKAALLQLSKSSAIDYAQYGITVNCVCPGSTDTNMLTQAIDTLVKKYPLEFQADYLAKCAEELPMQRYATVKEVADMVEFLASEKASYINGALIPIDGGSTA
tara:strand:- start:3394 stop:4110 length:717 start_codon:yes stop_codon:yes gene_type:complete